jgi:hypothetical protein
VRPVRFSAGLSSWLSSDHHPVLRAILLPCCRYARLAVSSSTSRRDHRPRSTKHGRVQDGNQLPHLAGGVGPQVCSNRAATRADLLKYWEKCQGQEPVHLQGFCNLQKLPANYHTAFTRQRSLVRSQHRPLEESGILQGERRGKDEAGYMSRLFLRQ